jgi:hypothetical protein
MFDIPDTLLRLYRTRDLIIRFVDQEIDIYPIQFPQPEVVWRFRQQPKLCRRDTVLLRSSRKPRFENP